MHLSQSLLASWLLPFVLAAFCLCYKFTHFALKLKLLCYSQQWQPVDNLAQGSNSSKKSFSVEREAMYFSEM
jgi:hypothetical protein